MRCEVIMADALPYLATKKKHPSHQYLEPEYNQKIGSKTILQCCLFLFIAPESSDPPTSLSSNQRKEMYSRKKMSMHVLSTTVNLAHDMQSETFSKTKA